MDHTTAHLLGSRLHEKLMVKRSSHGYDHVAVSCSVSQMLGLCRQWTDALALAQTEEQRREWERTKQELVLTKRKLMESVRPIAALLAMD